MSKFNEAQFLSNIDVDKITEEMNRNNDVNDQYNIFHNHLLRAINEIAPLKTLSNKENKSKIKPWITKGIRKSINRKNKIYKKYVKNKNENTYEEYKKIRNKLNHIIRESKRIHCSKYFFKRRHLLIYFFLFLIINVYFH